MTFLAQRTGDLTCDLCQERVKRLYPLTHYDHHVRRWKPVRVGRCCLGSWSSETFGSLNLPRRVILGAPDDES